MNYNGCQLKRSRCDLRRRAFIPPLGSGSEANLSRDKAAEPEPPARGKGFELDLSL